MRRYFPIPIPDISRVRSVHLQGIQGRSRSRLLQPLDNAANERFGLARRVKIFEKFNKKFSLLIKRPFENFHEIFGLDGFDGGGRLGRYVICDAYDARHISDNLAGELLENFE